MIITANNAPIIKWDILNYPLPWENGRRTAKMIYVPIPENLFVWHMRRKLYQVAFQSGIVTIDKKEGNYIFLWIPLHERSSHVLCECKLSVNSLPPDAQEIQLYERCLFDQEEYFMFDVKMTESERENIISSIKSLHQRMK